MRTASILVIDDQVENREFLVTLLAYKGHQMRAAADGAEGLAAVRAQRPDLVICDVLMPTMDGFEFVRALRADPEIADVKVIFYTAHFQEREARNLAKSCGVLHVLIKPCEPQLVLDVIAQALADTPDLQLAPAAGDFDRAHIRVVTDKLSEKIDELELANERLGALTDLNLKLASEREPATLLESVCRGARELLGAKFAVVGARGKANTHFSFFTTSGLDAKTAAQLEQIPVADSEFAKLLQDQQPRRFQNPDGNPRIVGLPAGYPPVHACILVPITSIAFVYGWICLIDKLGADEFSEEDLRITSVLGAQVGRNYENGLLYKIIRRQADFYSALSQTSQAILRIRDPEALCQKICDICVEYGHASIAYIGIVGDQRVEPVVWAGPAEGFLEGIALPLRPDCAEGAGPISIAVREGRPCVSNDFLNDPITLPWRERATGIGTLATGAFPFRRGGNIVGVLSIHVREKGFFNDQLIGLLEQMARDITQALDMFDHDSALRESERRFSDMLSSLQLVSMMVDRQAKITYCNESLLRLSGWTRDEVLGRDCYELFTPPEIREEMRRHYTVHIDDLPSAWHEESEIVTRSGARRLIRWNNTLLRTANGSTSGTASIGEDVTEQKIAEEKIRRLNRVYSVLSGINTLIVRTRERAELFREACRIAVEQGQFRLAWIGIANHAGGRLEVAASAGEDNGFLSLPRPLAGPTESADDGLLSTALQTKRAALCNDIEHAGGRVRWPKEALERGYRSVVVLPLIVDNESIGALLLYAGERNFFDEQEIVLLDELAGDISFALDHIGKAEQLEYLAYYDELTGLANSRLFRERVGQYVGAAGREGRKLAVVMFNIERFKTINDTLGRAAGDDLLRQIAERARCAIPDSNWIARIGGDHFAMVFPDMAEAGNVGRDIQVHYREIFDTPYLVNGTELRVNARVGIAIFPDDGADTDALMRNAEAALKNAKTSGERYSFYTQKMTERVAERLSLENKLRRALDNDEFVLHYQPKINLADGQIRGVEALLRWDDPETGLVAPSHFVSLLEETGLILEVGLWALRRSVTDYRYWADAGLVAPRIAVNVSPIQLRQRDFVEIVWGELANAGSPMGIDLEITESLIMEDVEGNIGKLKALREMGITIYIDDFGTGYSSLGYLARLPIQSLKIDRSFVITMLQDPNTMALVSTIISLAHSLRLKVVAEGVDKEEQAQILRLLRCEEMQGFLFSKPLPRDKLAALLAQQDG